VTVIAETATARALPPRRSPSVRWLLAATVLYLLVSVLVWWGIWSASPGSTSVCGCGDASRFLWFLEWPAFALTHGHSPFFSAWLNHPTGINLLNDTSVLGLGIPLIPLTLLAGPVISLNVALLLAPACSALAMFVLLRSLVRRPVIALVFGAAYGFATFVLDPASSGQLNLAFIALPPLMILLADDVIRQHRWPPRRAGMVLGLLVVWQFFLSPEILLIFAIVSVAGIVPLVVAVRAGRAGEGALARSVGTAASWTAGVSVVLLAYPTWYYFHGPAHLSGNIWGPDAKIWRWGTTLQSLVWPTGSPYGGAIQKFFGGIGPELPSYSYLGPGLVAAALLGLVLCRRDRVLQFALAAGAAALLLSLAPGTVWTPWSTLRHIAFLNNIAEYRFTVVTLLCVIVAAARAVDGGLDRLAELRPTLPSAGLTAVGAGLCAALLVPNVVTVAPVLPLATVPSTLPTWFRVLGAHLPPGQVLLTYPAPFSGLQASQAWQAKNAMRWAQAGVGGPAGTLARAGSVARGYQLLNDAAYLFVPSPQLIPGRVRDVRLAIHRWGVTKVVVPDQETLGPGARARSTAWAVGFFTTIMGRAPHRQPGAWVWPVTDPLPAVSESLVARYQVCQTHPDIPVASMLQCLAPRLTAS